MHYATYSVHPGVWHGNCFACMTTASVGYGAVCLGRTVRSLLGPRPCSGMLTNYFCKE